PIHGGQGILVTVSLPENSPLAGRTVAQVFDQHPELLLVAIIRKQRIQLPRGPSRIEAGDQLLIAASEASNVRAFSDAIINKPDELVGVH
ncbi:MAG: TrkA C-terminal domain-containing protein, partial [Candidatus Binatia bacterium]